MNNLNVTDNNYKCVVNNSIINENDINDNGILTKMFK